MIYNTFYIICLCQSVGPHLVTDKKNNNNFIYLFLTSLGLHCCTGLSLAVENGGYSLVAVPRFPIAMASLAVEHGAQWCTTLSNEGPGPQLLWLMGSVAVAPSQAQ